MLTIYPVPALDTNYIWLLQPDAATPDVYIVDPGDAEPVFAAVEQRGLRPVGVLLTHHHWDHTDGLPALLARYPVPVYGPRSRRIPHVTHPLEDGELLALPGLEFEIIAVPGHTLDHIVYFQHQDGQPRVFCGDALFAAGCGRMFEGQPAQMLASLERLAALPAATLVYCAHEYTLPNLDFARHLEPDNTELIERCITTLAQRRQQKITLPSTIGLEIRTNPFLRCHLPAIRQAAEQHCGKSLTDPAAVFACLREWKDNFQTGASFLDRYGRNP